MEYGPNELQSTHKGISNMTTYLFEHAQNSKFLGFLPFLFLLYLFAPVFDLLQKQTFIKGSSTATILNPESSGSLTSG